MKSFYLTALAAVLASHSAFALTVKSADILNKTNLVSVQKIPAAPAMQEILTDSKGISLYTFDLDKEGVSVCKGGCLTVWPTLSVNPGEKVEAPFGTIMGNNGKPQLTLKGLPLYYFHKDKKPGDVLGDYPDWQLITVEN